MVRSQYSILSVLFVLLVAQAGGSLRQGKGNCSERVMQKSHHISRQAEKVLNNNKRFDSNDWREVEIDVREMLACDSVGHALRSIDEILSIGIAVGDWDKYLHFCRMADTILNRHKDFPHLRRFQMISLASWKIYHWQKNDLNAYRLTQEIIVDSLDGKKCLDKEEANLLVEALRHLGNFALDEYNSEKALHYYTKVLSLAPDDVLSYKKLGDYYYYIYDTANAFRYYKEGILRGMEQMDTAQNESASLVDLILRSANQKLNAGDITGAEKDASLLQKYTTPNPYNRLESIKLRARLFAAGEKHILSNKFYREYLEKGTEIWGTHKSEIINTYLSIAENDLEMGKANEGLENIRRALNKTMLHTGSEMLVDHLNLKSILFVPEAVRGLNLKSKALYGQGNFMRSGIVNGKAIQLIQDIQSRITHNNDLSLVNAEFKDIYEQHLDILYHLHSHMATDPKLAEEVLTTFEQSKNSSLLNSFRNSKALSFSGIPSNLIARETGLKQKIAADMELLKNQFARSNDGIADSLVHIINSTQREYQQLIDHFEEKYPNYFALRYQKSFASIRNVRRMLSSPKKAMIQYFLGHTQIYALLVSDQQTQFYQLGKTDSLLPDIKYITAGMRGHLSANLQQSSQWDKQFAVSATSMYQKLIAPIQPNLNDINELVLIVDGELVNVPFDILLTNTIDSANIGNYSQYPYLIRQYALSYNLSSTLWYEMNQADVSGKVNNWYGFAPDYQTTRGGGGLVALENTGKEIKTIGNKLNGTVYSGVKANKKAFKEVLATNSIVQFAGHCVFNDIEPDSSFLAFTRIGEKSDSWRLLNDEIYSMHVNARYLVLSACETGSGKWQRGEGVISMARAFSFAGASAILSTLWKVEDQSAARIVTRIYDYLAEGETKSVALQRSKLDYLRLANNAEAHPFNWAPFITIGNIQPLEMSTAEAGTTVPVEVYIGGVMFVLMLAFLAVRHRIK